MTSNSTAGHKGMPEAARITRWWAEHWAEEGMNETRRPDPSWPTCMACGRQRADCVHKRLERAHIVGVEQGGGHHPSNIVMLCQDCHEDSPHVTDRAVVLEWMRARPSGVLVTARLMGHPDVLAAFAEAQALDGFTWEQSARATAEFQRLCDTSSIGGHNGRIQASSFAWAIRESLRVATAGLPT